MKLARLILLSLAACASFTAAAQRTPVPVVDFKDILVSASTAAPLTAEQVKKAITAAAIAERWETSPESRYAVARAQGVIHPFYETWVHRLLDGARRQLQQ